MSFEHLADDEGAAAAHERRIKRCKLRGCNARIIWFRTQAGKNVAVDADTVEVSDQEYDYVRHTCHFGVCKRSL